MAALTEGTGYDVKYGTFGPFSVALIRVINTADAADTLTLTLANVGIHASGLIGVIGFKHTTDNSVAVQEQPTTSVTSGVVTLTIPAGTDNDPRFYLVFGMSETAGVSALP